MKRPVSGLLGVVLAMLVGALPAWAQRVLWGREDTP